MINSKQRAKLRSIANTLETVVQVGKGGLTGPVAASVSEALAARELIKGSVLESSPLTAAEAAAGLADACGADIVQVIGRRFVLYRRNPEKPVIAL